MEVIYLKKLNLKCLYLQIIKYLKEHVRCQLLEVFMGLAESVNQNDFFLTKYVYFYLYLSQILIFP